MAVFAFSAVLLGGAFVLAKYRPDPVSNMTNLAIEPRHPVTLKMEEDAKAVIGEPAPEIVLPDTEGVTQRLSSFLAKGPVVVITLKDGCPCSIEAQPFFNTLAENYKDKVSFVAVMDASKQKSSKFRDDFSVPYTILSESSLHTFEAYKSPRSVYFTLIDRHGVVKHLWPGYSKKTLLAFNEMLALEAGVQPVALDVSMAPDRESSGCLFDGKALSQ